MKTTFCYNSKSHLLVLGLLFLSLSCVQQSEFVEEEQKCPAPGITASLVSEDNIPTKTTLTVNSEGVGKIYWCPEDQINVFFGQTGTKYTSNNSENALAASFESTDTVSPTELASQNYWGLYPYNPEATCDGESVLSVLPNIQQGISGSFDDDLFITLAHSDNFNLQFKNVCGGLKFSLQRDDIKSISFSGLADELLAGTIRISIVDGKPKATVIAGQRELSLTPKDGGTFKKGEFYYLIMLPVSLSGGFKMTFETDSEEGVFEYTAKQIDITRGHFSRVASIDEYATFQAVGTNSRIVYSTTDNSIMTLNSGAFDAQIASHVYDDDNMEGTIEFNGTLKTINASAFADITTLKTITIPNGVTSVGRRAFENCSALFTVALPESVETLGEECFRNCSTLRNINLPESLTTLGLGAFANCSNLRAITIPSQITVLRQDLFFHCTSLKTVSFADGSLLKTIEGRGGEPSVETTGPFWAYTYDGAFAYCSSLSTCTLPDSVEDIQSEAFRASGIETLNLPASLKHIGEYAFKDSKLKAISIPNSVTSIENQAFSCCSSLVSAEINAPVSSLDYAFDYCTNLQSVTLSAGLTSIRGTFMGCSKLSSVNIPSSVTSIENSAFYNCERLTSILLPSNLVTIGDSAFYGCGLTTVTIPNGVTTIGERAFRNSSLSTITIPSSVTSLGDYAFANCSALTSVSVPSSVKTLGANAFFYCTALKEASLDCGTIKYGAFTDCSSLETVMLGRHVGSISSVSFERCPHLTSFHSQSNSIDATDDGRCLVGYDGTLLAFAPCGLTSYSIPEYTTQYDIEYIGAGVFYNVGLSALIVPKTILGIGKLAFAHDTSSPYINALYFLSETPPIISWTSNLVDSSLGEWMVGNTRTPIDGSSVYVPEQSLSAYKSAWSWYSGIYPIGETVTGLQASNYVLIAGETATIHVDFVPFTASAQLTYSSLRPDIASVDESGLVRAINPGRAQITILTESGSIGTTSWVYVISAEDYVDFGTGVKWASRNLGASSVESYGNFYAWGETSPKTSFTESNYQYSPSMSTPTLPSENDAATVALGSGYRMPTLNDLYNLSSAVTSYWVERNGISGLVLIGRKSGYTNKGIFIPASGTSLYGARPGSASYFWTSTLMNNNYAYYLYGGSSSSVSNSYGNCYIGMPVRAVKN